MNLGLLLAHKFLQHKKKGFGNLVHNIGILIITIGLAGLLIFVLALQGMEKAIQDKIMRLSGHIFIKKQTYDNLREFPLSKKTIQRLKLKNLKNIRGITTSSKKLVLLKNNDTSIGVIFNGINYKRKIYNGIYKNLIEGKVKFGTKHNGIIISAKMAKQLNLKLNNYVIGYFVQNIPKIRKLKINGIYRTFLPEIDEKLVICSEKLIQKINKWSNYKSGNIEIFVNDISKLDQVHKQIKNRLDSDLFSYSIKKIYVSVFDWFKILNQNKVILIIMVLIIACANICSILIVKILETTKYVGILSILGAKQSLIYKIYFWISVDIIFKGFFYGNILGIILCLIQHFTKIIKLDVEGVFIPHAIIDWDIFTILGLNFICFFSLLILIFTFILILNQTRKIILLKFE